MLQKKTNSNEELLTFGGHLEVFRQMLFRIFGVSGFIAVVVFCFKDQTFELLLAPGEWNFCTYRWLETAMQVIGIDFRFEEYHINLIAVHPAKERIEYNLAPCFHGFFGCKSHMRGYDGVLAM